MVRTTDREELRTASGTTEQRERVERPVPTIEEVRTVVEGPSAPPRRPIRWMRWLGAFAVLAAIAGVVAIAMRDDTTDTTLYQVPRTADGAEGWIESTMAPDLVDIRMLPLAAPMVADGVGNHEVSYLPVTQVPTYVVTPETPVTLAVQPILVSEFQFEVAVPRTADGTELRIVSMLERGVTPRSADGSEGWIVSAAPVISTVPRSADGSEGWIVSTAPVISTVPRSADGSEGWIVSTAPVIRTVPRTADGTEGRIESMLARGVTPRSADGSEGWILAAG